jgi:DNA-binding NarL/FixJ family response regulator
MSPQSKAVLIADDNNGVRSALRSFLERNTELSVCGEAVDGTDAIEKAKELHPGLVLMDLSMPNTNGIEAAWTIKGVMPDVKIVVFTLYTDLLTKSLAMRAGVDLVVPKSEGALGLLKALRPLLDSYTGPVS